MSTADVKNNAQTRMNKSIETLRADLAKVRTGRAHTGILDHVMVDYYGNPTPLKQLANDHDPIIRDLITRALESLGSLKPSQAFELAALVERPA